MARKTASKSLWQQRRISAASYVGDYAGVLLVTNKHNVRWLTGFTGSNGVVLLWPSGEALFFTDPRYTTQAKSLDCKTKTAKGSLTAAALEYLATKKTTRIAFEPGNLTVSQYDTLQSSLPLGAEMVSFPPVIEQLRMVKSADEIEEIRTAVDINSQALEAAIRAFKPGMTEAEMAARIDYASRKLGADGPAFDSIVLSGKRAALPHGHPDSTKIGPGILLIDIGAFHNGYASDMTRTYHVGPATRKFRKAYYAVLDAQLAAIAHIKPGVTAGSVDDVARKVLRKHKLEKSFIHSTGHGLGLEIHEPPRLGRKDPIVLQPGMLITVEPGIYLEGWGGIRIEDTVLVTEDGCEILTPTSKALREI